MLTPAEVLEMSFFIGTCLAAFSAVLYLAGTRQAFTPVCNYTMDLCQNPTWPLFVAAAFFAFGLLFRVDRI